MDKPTQSRIDTLHPAIRQQVSKAVNEANEKLTGRSQVRIIQGYRTHKEQDALYQQGRTTKGSIVTNAPAGSSFHNYGLAVDFCLLVDGTSISWDMKKDFDNDNIADWMEVVNVFTKAKFEWGGLWKFKDFPHFQMSYSYKWQQLLAKYNRKDFITGTSYVNL